LDAASSAGGVIAAFLISDAGVRPTVLRAGRDHAADSIMKYKERYLARGGAVEPMEGPWRPRKIIPVLFPSMKQEPD